MAARVQTWLQVASISYATFVATWCLAHHFGGIPSPADAASAIVTLIP
ncbi:MAG TPA: hypothetical protein VNZ52_16525 [Candidatus Thermoplasmatota archaeon]|nr:hypothetical protein [Candidatus Thermoplasmatota archaeon]